MGSQSHGGGQGFPAQLRRHLTAGFLSDEQRQAAQVALRQDPDAKELAMLGELASASAVEKAATNNAQWVFAYADAAYDPSHEFLTLSDTALAWDGRPIMVSLGQSNVLFAQQQGGFVELRWRSEGEDAQVWIGKVADMTASSAPVMVTGDADNGFELSLK